MSDTEKLRSMDILSLLISPASSIDREENTTYGHIVTLQIGPFVLEFWVTKRKPRPEGF